MTNFSLQISEDVFAYSRLSSLRDPSPPLSGMSNGRPPDVKLQVLVPNRLLRSSNGMICDDSGDKQAERRASIKSSFRDMLTGNKSHALRVSAMPKLDVELHDEDVHILFVDGTHVINFSDRIHDKMQAPSRKARKAMRDRSSDDTGLLNHPKVTSEAGMFDVLSSLEHDIESQEMHTIQTTLPGHGNHLNNNSQNGIGNGAIQPRESIQGGSLGAPKEVRNVGMLVLHGSGSNSNVNKVVEDVSMGQLELHLIDEMTLEFKCRHLKLVTGVVGGKGVDPKGSYSQKKQEPRPSSKIVLGEWLGNMERELEGPKAR
ncbi:hypothetical protein V6N12_061591 [Hibiscus sabdariffa]|uniref:Uncharacterized protein n=1 Tax=Hibiscus sabdariffa TaxID=183260 RepID=A0ABR2DXH5_9ROSI